MIYAGAFLGWLYFWLRGHWFARVLGFFFFGAWFTLCGGKKIMGDTAEPLSAAFYVLGSLIIAWLVASLPIYYHRGGWRRHIPRLPRPPVLYDGAGISRR